MTDDVITLNATWEDMMGRCYLVVCHSSTYEIVKFIKLFLKNASEDSGRFFYDNCNLLF